MAKVKLGTKSFSAESEEIDASRSRVADADCVAFCAQLSAGDFKKLRVLKLVSFFLFLCWFLYCACFGVARSQGGPADVCGAAVQRYRRRGRQGAGGSAEGQYQCADTVSCKCIRVVFVGFMFCACFVVARSQGG